MVHSRVDFPDTSVQRSQLGECVTMKTKAVSDRQNSVLRCPAQNAQILVFDRSEHGRESLSRKAQSCTEESEFHWMSVITR